MRKFSPAPWFLPTVSFSAGRSPGAIALAVLIGLALAMGARAVPAHPHAWVDLESRLLFDKQGRIIRLAMTWTFDEFHTAYLREQLPSPAPDNPAKALADQLMARIAPLDHLVDLRIDDRRQVLTPDGEWVATFTAARFSLSFALDLPAPVDPRRHRLTYAIFDPSHYLRMQQVATRPVVLEGTAAKGCAAMVEEPRPDQGELARLVLDPANDGPAPLGALLAERVRITC